MTLAQLIAQLRIDLDDTEEDYLWSDDELTLYINEAEKEAVRRSRLIIDQSTAEICQINVTANTSLYPLSKKIIQVLDVIPSWDDGCPLRKAVTREMTLHNPSWRSDESETPESYLLDFQSNYLMLGQKPLSDGTLNLRVYREPLAAMAEDDDEPEIAERYHRKLLHWARHEAYLKPDADTQDKAASSDALALFELEFGPAMSAWADEFDNYNLPNDLYHGAY